MEDGDTFEQSAAGSSRWKVPRALSPAEFRALFDGEPMHLRSCLDAVARHGDQLATRRSATQTFEHLLGEFSGRGAHVLHQARPELLRQARGWSAQSAREIAELAWVNLDRSHGMLGDLVRRLRAVAEVAEAREQDKLTSDDCDLLIRLLQPERSDLSATLDPGQLEQLQSLAQRHQVLALIVPTAASIVSTELRLALGRFA